jgi:hypothetical protein
MQGFVSERDDHVEPGYAVGYRSTAKDAYFGVAVLALETDALTEAEEWASTLSPDPSFAIEAGETSNAATIDRDPAPSANGDSRGRWKQKLRRRRG